MIVIYLHLTYNVQGVKINEDDPRTFSRLLKRKSSSPSLFIRNGTLGVMNHQDS